MNHGNKRRSNPRPTWFFFLFLFQDGNEKKQGPSPICNGRFNVSFTGVTEREKNTARARITWLGEIALAWVAAIFGLMCVAVVATDKSKDKYLSTLSGR